MGIEDPRGDQVHAELAILVDDGVPGVAAATKTGHGVGALGQIVHHLPFPLIPPLAPQDSYGRHGLLTMPEKPFFVKGLWRMTVRKPAGRNRARFRVNKSQ